MFVRMIKWVAKTTLKITLTMFLVVIVFSIIAGAMAGSMAPKPVEVKANSYLSLTFPGGLSEVAKQDINLMKINLKDLGKKKLTFYKTLGAIENASTDSRIKGIIINLDKWYVSTEHTAEIIKVLDRFKKSGKKVIAYGNYLANTNYTIASVADEIVMPPSSSAMINLTGYNLSVSYYKDLGDKLGVTMNVIHIGDYKSAGENYTKNKMSKEFKGELEKVFSKRSQNYTQLVAGNRNIPEQEFEKMLYDGKFAMISPFKAKELKIIDKTMHYRDLESSLKEEGSKELNTVSIADYATVDFKTAKSKNKIAILFAEGEIKMEQGEGIALANNKAIITPGNIIPELKKIAEDDDIKALVLRINSPGGSALASEIIFQEIMKLKSKKPVIVSQGSVAASGGYYLSCMGDKIFSEKTTITGSIGVVSMIPNISGLMKKLGVNNEKVNKGKFSDLFELTKEVTKDEIKLIRNSMLSTYTEFKSRVSEGRKISMDDLEKIAQGRIWTGEQAKEIGLIDEIGGLEAAIQEAVALSKVTDYEINTFPAEKTMAEEIFDIKIETGASLGLLESVEELKTLAADIERAKAYNCKPLMLLPVDLVK